MTAGAGHRKVSLVSISLCYLRTLPGLPLCDKCSESVWLHVKFSNEMTSIP